MSDNSKPVTSLPIARHTLQSILRTAIDAEPAQCIGIIGKKNSLTINQAAPIHYAEGEKCADRIHKNSDLQHILELWKTEGIMPCGIFFTVESGEITDQAELEKLDAEFRKAAPHSTGDAPILMPLMLNTAGCLEAFAYHIDRNSLIPIPLTLEEDGQSVKNG